MDTLLFDLDGTLLYTLEDLADSTNAALAACGYPTRDIDEVRRFVGNGIRRLIQRAMPPGSTEEAQAACLAQFRTYYAAHLCDKTRPYPGVLETLCRLKDKGYTMAIVSNKQDDAVQVLRQTFFADLIPLAIGNQPGMETKPAPDMVLAALNALGKGAADALYIGDSGVDVETARNSGLPCVGVSWGFRPREDLAGADYIIDRPEQLLDILQGGKA